MTTMTMTTRQLLKHGYTHFTPNNRGTSFKAFKMEACETCGGPIAAANSITLHEPRARLEAMGLMFVADHPNEGYYDEDTGMEVCDDCPDADGVSQNDLDRIEHGMDEHAPIA